MGLTIAYKISSRERLSPTVARKIVVALREKAVALGFTEVSRLIKVGPDYPLTYWLPPGAKRAADMVMASDGWVFHATPGAGSESVQLGLCRFPGREGWWLEGFCKTQYASRHGWEHFLKCHCAVIDLLFYATRYLRVEVEDEGDLWNSGSFAVLRRNLDEYNRDIAAFSGALKDANESGKNAVSPIFEHPHFERLEAEGLAAHGGKVGEAVEIVKQFVR